MNGQFAKQAHFFNVFYSSAVYMLQIHIFVIDLHAVTTQQLLIDT